MKNFRPRIAHIDDLEYVYEHAKGGAMEIMVEYWERVQIQDLILYGLCSNTLNEKNLDQLVALLRAMHMVRDGLLTWAKEIITAIRDPAKDLKYNYQDGITPGTGRVRGCATCSMKLVQGRSANRPSSSCHERLSSPQR